MARFPFCKLGIYGFLKVLQVGLQYILITYDYPDGNILETSKIYILYFCTISLVLGIVINLICSYRRSKNFFGEAVHAFGTLAWFIFFFFCIYVTGLSKQSGSSMVEESFSHGTDTLHFPWGVLTLLSIIDLFLQSAVYIVSQCFYTLYKRYRRQNVTPRHGNENIPLHANENVRLPANENIHLPANENIRLPAIENIRLPANENIRLPANENMRLPANENIRLPVDDFPPPYNDAVAMENENERKETPPPKYEVIISEIFGKLRLDSSGSSEGSIENEPHPPLNFPEPHPPLNFQEPNLPLNFPDPPPEYEGPSSRSSLLLPPYSPTNQEAYSIPHNPPINWGASTSHSSTTDEERLPLRSRLRRTSQDSDYSDEEAIETSQL